MAGPVRPGRREGVAQRVLREGATVWPKLLIDQCERCSNIPREEEWNGVHVAWLRTNGKGPQLLGEQLLVSKSDESAGLRGRPASSPGHDGAQPLSLGRARALALGVTDLGNPDEAKLEEVNRADDAVVGDDLRDEPVLRRIWK